MGTLLVVAGEGSGDALAAPVIARLPSPSFGLGGAHLAAAGMELVADLRPVAAMGGLAVVKRAPALARAVLALGTTVRERRPSAALLVGFSELNARLARWLKRRGVRVVWYAPPQVWAWRPGRARSIAATCDRLAVVLPFEVPIWREAHACADYVGHPAAGPAFAPASASGGRTRLVLLPGSRAQEVHAHLAPMLSAAERLSRRTPRLEVAVVRAPALDAATSAWVERTTTARGVGVVVDAPLSTAVRRAHAALVSSGTATLECASVGVPPVVVYRTDPLTHAVAKRVVRVAHVGLPNLVLGRRAFPELLQGDVTAERLASAVSDVLRDHASYVASCATVREALALGLDERPPADRVAAMLEPWLA